MSNFIETREVIERLKDRLSHEVDGKVFDWHVADELKIPYSTLRIKIMKDKMPVREIVLFCYKRKIDIKSVIF